MRNEVDIAALDLRYQGYRMKNAALEGKILAEVLSALPDALKGQIAAISKAQAVIEFDLAGKVLTANDNFLKTLGYTLEEIRGKHHRMFMDAGQRESADYRGFWDKLGRGEAQSGQFRRVGRNGRDVWLQGRGAGLSKRLDAILDRTVTDVQIAERALNYVVSGNHVAAIAWLDDPARPLDTADAERRVAALPGVRDSLLVPRDERTLYVWLHVVGKDRIPEWMKVLADQEDVRIAFGELAAGIEGFRLSHKQAQSAGAVIAASQRREKTVIVRYRDVAVLSFLVDRQAESKAWSEAVLGDLAGDGEDREGLRETLAVFLEEGENAVAAAQRLFVHRNTVKYRVDRASALLPGPIGRRRLEVALALRYCEHVGCGTETD